MERASQGIFCLSMVTPSVNPNTIFLPVYLHSKFAVIDNEYMLGSTNIGDQSFLTDSETDINVPDPIETKKAIKVFFPALIGGVVAPNLSSYLNRMGRVAAKNYDVEEGIRPGPTVGLLTEFPYRG